MSRSSKVWKHFDQVAELRSGRPKVICRSCLTPLNHPHHPHHKSHGTSTMGKHLKSNSCRRSKETVSISAVTPGPIQAARASFSPMRSQFTKAQLEVQLLRTITSANLSFGLTEEPTFRELLDLVSAGPQALEIPSLKQLRQHMHDMVTVYQQSQPHDLPGDSKVSLVFCCWKSPLGQDFMAITACYFDKQWSYREVLLGFELLCSTFSIFTWRLFHFAQNLHNSYISPAFFEKFIGQFSPNMPSTSFASKVRIFHAP
jgi:hypothetical protein